MAQGIPPQVQSSNIITPKQYYENSDNWGKSQFISLKDILDNILITADDDSYFKHTKRFRARVLAKQGLKQLKVDIGVQNKAIAIDVPPSKIFPFPQYMTDWMRVSVINSCGKLYELDINNSPYISGYLQDHNADLLFDNNGDVLEDNGITASSKYCKFDIDCEDKNPCKENNTAFKKSWVREDKSAGYFEFSEDLVDKTVVIEYKNAGLDNVDDCDIKINHNLELAITYWTKWKLLESKRNVPMNEVLYLENQFKIQKKRSKALMGKKITISQILEGVSRRYLN